MNKRLLIVLAMLFSMTSLFAQTDYTSYIKNPSFENNTTGWVQTNMSAQGNSVFDIKAGNTYMEKWTGRGGAVGSAALSQEIQGMPPGNYELTVAAQNIQEDSPTAAQTGAWIYAGNQKTTVTVRGQYTVAFTYVSGVITIGFEARNASGNWIACDNFRLKLVGQNLKPEIEATIASAQAEIIALGSSAAELEQLQDAIAAAQNVVANANATGSEQVTAVQNLLSAIDVFRRANASEQNPLDVTGLIKNPSFETGNLTGWTTGGMGIQGNNVFNIKQGSYYVEKWTGRGGAVGDARISQTLTDLAPGRYRLKAAAQNIQEDSPNVKQTGAWIFAGLNQEPVNVRGEYTLTFTLVSDELEIGFEAKNAQGNWISCDNFRLEFIGDNADEVTAAFTALIAKSETLAAQRMNSTALQALQTAINAAKAALEGSSVEAQAAAATALETAYNDAAASAEVFARLAAAIQKANDEVTGSSAANKDTYLQGIAQAQGIYDNSATTDAQAEAAILALDDAAFAFRIDNGTGTVPKVTTDKRFIKGCTWAFGRSTVSGSNILEEGFCWSENPDPKVTDNRTTEYLNQAGKIYWLRDLKPGTMYYMRAYAITKNYAVGYGDVIKFATVPKGTVGHSYNNGGDQATNDRINYAIDLSMDYYWNNLTSIHGFGITVNYSPGTPTADCSYGGWMRVGESSSYQQPGTIMHEAFHGIGVGTHGIWWDGEMRSGGNRGDWLGDRVTEAVRFWDNSTTAVITGDDMHLWPYGCNGAHEDTHNDNLYCMMGILAQALNEDGLPGSGAIGYALPYYSFNHEDGVKYYLKNEDPERGLNNSYLVETASHTLQWKTMSAEEAAVDDHAAWYLSFTPGNQYYQLKNAATGYYMTYASGVKTAGHAKPTSADNFHLMRGRVDVSAGKGAAKHRGYYIIHPESSANPPTLVANADGKTGTTAWSIAKGATTMRWLILTAEEAAAFESGAVDVSRKELETLVAQIRKTAETPHTEDVEGVDNTLTTTLDEILTQGKASNSTSELSTLTEQARAAGLAFLSGVTVSNEEQPFDLTYMLQNPDFDTDATTGWTTNQTPGYSYQTAEFFEKTFNFYQTLKNMPAGTYKLTANAFQRPGAYDAVLQPFLKGTAKVTSSLYIGSTSATVKHICEGRQKDSPHSGSKWLSDDTYIPDNMASAAAYFAKGLYESSVTANQTKPGSLRVGIKCTSAPGAYWTMFDRFRLYYYGGNTTAVGIAEMEDGRWRMEDEVIYDLSGRRVQSPIFNLQSKKGVYIMNGRKVLVK